MSSHKFITVIGNIASGKSTLTRLMGKKIKAKQIPADSLFRVNPFFPLALSDRPRWSLASDMWFFYERLKLERKIPRQLRDNHVIVDSGLPMSFVYARSRLISGYLTKNEWKLYKAIHDELLPTAKFPDTIIYLQTPVDTILKRIKRRRRQFELKHYSAKYLRGLEQSLEMVVKKLAKRKVRIIAIDTTQIDFIHNENDLDQLIKEVV
jgi:deoxyadenosine/deoxycytidine kinase